MFYIFLEVHCLKINQEIHLISMCVSPAKCSRYYLHNVNQVPGTKLFKYKFSLSK